VFAFDLLAFLTHVAAVILGNAAWWNLTREESP
jgi:hypothetical protein